MKALAMFAGCCIVGLGAAYLLSAVAVEFLT